MRNDKQIKFMFPHPVLPRGFFRQFPFPFYRKIRNGTVDLTLSKTGAATMAARTPEYEGARPSSAGCVQTPFIVDLVKSRSQVETIRPE